MASTEDPQDQRGASGPILALAIFTVTALVLTGVAIALLSRGDGSSASTDSAQTSSLKAVFSTCKEQLGSTDTGPGYSVSADDLMSLGGEGHSITVANESSASGDFVGILTAAVVTCLLNETDAPDSLASEIEQTTAIMGRQSESWGDLTFEWSYHPDNGISAVLKQSD